MPGMNGNSCPWRLTRSSKPRSCLKVQLEAADAIGFTEYADYAALYDKADAKVEEIEKAVEDLKADIIDYGYSVATEDNPFGRDRKIRERTVFLPIARTDGTSRKVSGAKYQRKTGDRFREWSGKFTGRVSP